MKISPLNTPYTMNKLLKNISFPPASLLALPLMLALSSCSKYDQYGNTRFIWIIILVLDVLAMFDVFRQPWTIGKKILWLAIIYFMPFLGLIIYYMFSGRGKSNTGVV
ncbi:PLD nuclease N-terminal domain-containing protein [Hymenobacter sp. UYP22]|uniref:PLD nuclease N-terminal domain-containing protein n=1 Tax=Hymenobacter sp. UYP22 TaxID=3156348 RepID=UPI00339844A6